MFGRWYGGSSWIWSQYGCYCDQYGDPDTNGINSTTDAWAESNASSGRGTVACSAPWLHYCSLRCDYPYPTADTDN